MRSYQPQKVQATWSLASEMLRADHPWGQKPPPFLCLRNKLRSRPRMNEQEARAQYGSGAGWRHQSHGSGAWPWAMMEEAGTALLTAASPWPAALAVGSWAA